MAAALLPPLMLLLGFVWFVHRVTAPPRPPPAHADGIVVLTGGADRVGFAFRLLAQGRAPLLLVSGVAPGADLREVAASAGVPTPPAARVTLGHKATTTLGNAAETAAWAHRHGLNSLIVVTASYHMPRALALLRRALPDVRLYASAVRPEALLTPERPSTLRLLAEEYVKWLIALCGLTRDAERLRAL